jgi:uncharacterized protein (TIGR02996 family)
MNAERSRWSVAVETSPHDDGLRRKYADWLEERGDTARAEFIRLQCDQARCDQAAPETSQLLRELVEFFWAQVASHLPGQMIVLPEREPGASAFVPPEDCGPASLARREGSSQIRRAPIISESVGRRWGVRRWEIRFDRPSPGNIYLALTWAGDFWLELSGYSSSEYVLELGRSPALAHVGRLGLVDYQGARYSHVFGPPALRQLLRSPHLSCLRWFGVYPIIREYFIATAVELEALAEAPNLGTLATLDLWHAYQQQEQGLYALARSRTLTGLSTLRLSGDCYGDPYHAPFVEGLAAYLFSANARGLIHLSIPINGPIAKALLRSPQLGRLERLEMEAYYPGVTERELRRRYPAVPPMDPEQLVELRARFGAAAIHLHEVGGMLVVQQRFQIGDQVVAQVNDRRRAPVEGFIRKVRWDEEAGRYSYYLIDVAGQLRPECFYEDELVSVRSFPSRQQMAGGEADHP